VLGRVDQGRRLLALHLAFQRVEFGQAVDLVAPELHADGVAAVHREHLDGVAPNPEGALREVHVVAVVVQVD